MGRTLINKARFTDLVQVHEIEKESINSWTLNQFSEELNRSFSIFIVAETDGEITGYAVAWLVAGELQINSIAVKKSHRREGIGKLLLEGLIGNDRRNSITSIQIDVRRKNIAALGFYTSNGFKETGIRKNYYGDDDAILMEKYIS